MMPSQQHNFGAGPCILPQPVLEKAASAVLNWEGAGLSILEVSHRSPRFEKVMLDAKTLVRELLEVPEDYEVLFLQGGASTQFEMVPRNLLQGSGKKKAAYLDTGYFAIKAIAQARHFGEVQIVASSREKSYSYVPENYSVHHDCAYLHVTSNNTIEGTQLSTMKGCGVPLVCDMSSDIFSRKINIKDFGLIYAGAQKNMGPAGMTLVIIDKKLLKQINRPLPAMSDYRIHAENGCLYNTPPVFAIYVAMLNMQWLKAQGGVAAIEKINIKKAQLLYDAIDRSEIFYGTAENSSRSMMNVAFQCQQKRHEEGFLDYAAQHGIVGIKGFKAVGGFRASLYNALPIESVEYLVKLMGWYEKTESLKKINAAQQNAAQWITA